MARKWSIILTIFCLFLIFDFIELIKAQRYRKKQKYERINFNNHRRAISEEAPTFSPPRDWPIDLRYLNSLNNSIFTLNKINFFSYREGQKLNKTMSCATSLVDQYTEVCELVYRIGQLHQLLPHLNELIVKRMGGRKFIFTIYMNRSSSTVDMLTDAGKALLRCIGKFIRFLGYVEKLFSATMGTSETSIDKNSLNRRGFFGPPERTGFLGEVSNTATVNEDEIQRNVKKAWSRKCSLELLKWENDICGIISRITKLDGLLKNSILELEPSVSSMTIPVKLSSEKLSLTDFFDALHVALLKARNIKDFEGRRAAEIKTKYIGGKRILLNDKEEPVEEIFETPEFKIELIKNDRRKKIIYLPERKRGTTSKPPAGNRRDARNRGRGRFSNHRHKFGELKILYFSV